MTGPGGIEGDSLASRHLSAEGLAQFIEAHVPVDIRIEGEPEVFLVIDPGARRMALRVRSESPELPNLEGFRNISAAVTSYRGETYAEISIDGGDALVDAYPILCALADRIQIDGDTLEDASREVLGNFRKLLQGIGRLSESAEIGLFGELSFLIHLIGISGPHEAIASWTGADHEEHDFLVANYDIEVKTTTGERRQHWIHGLSQLTPSPGRPLWLLSIQLTSNVGDAPTLGECVAAVRLIVPHAADLNELNRKLLAYGWDDEQKSLYTRRFTLRNAPQAFVVDDQFPSLSEERLVRAEVGVERITQIDYRIDLTGMHEASHLPAPVESFGTKE